MPSPKLPGTVAAYVDAANAQDASAVAACFHEEAMVTDEGRSRQGLAAIREWAEEVGQKYRPAVEVLDSVETDSRTIVTGRVSGNFPGSPIDLRYAFTLSGEKIIRLEIS
jgi:hypothetical protein